MDCVGASGALAPSARLNLAELEPTSYNAKLHYIRRRMRQDPRYAMQFQLEEYPFFTGGTMAYKARDNALVIGFVVNINNVFRERLLDDEPESLRDGIFNRPVFDALEYYEGQLLYQFLETIRQVVITATYELFGHQEGYEVVLQTTRNTVAYVVHFDPRVPQDQMQEAAVCTMARVNDLLTEWHVVLVDALVAATVGAPGDLDDGPRVYEYKYNGEDVTIRLKYDNRRTLFDMTISSSPGEHFDGARVAQITGGPVPRTAASSTVVHRDTQEHLEKLLQLAKEWLPEVQWVQDTTFGVVQAHYRSNQPGVGYHNSRWVLHIRMLQELCYRMGWHLEGDSGADSGFNPKFMMATIMSHKERELDRRVEASKPSLKRSESTPTTRKEKRMPLRGMFAIDEESGETPMKRQRVDFTGGAYEGAWPEDIERAVKSYVSGIFEEDEETPALPEDARRNIYSFLNPIEQATVARSTKMLHDDVQPNINRIKKKTQEAVQKSMLQHGGGFLNNLELKAPSGSWLSGVGFATSLSQSSQGALELNFSASLPEGVYFTYTDFQRFAVLGNAIRQPKKPLASAETRQAVVAWVNAVFALTRRYGVTVAGGHVAERALSFYMWSNKAATVQRDLVMQLQSHGWTVVVKHGMATLGVVHTPHWVGGSFDELPDELKGHILGRLAPRDRSVAAQVNHKTHALIKLGQHGNRLQAHANITGDLATKRFVNYELVPQGGTPAIITLSLQKPDVITLTIVTNFADVIDYHPILDFGLTHAPNNRNLEELDEPLNETLQSTVRTVVSLFMAALAHYKTPVHYSGANTNYVSIWAQNRSRYRDIAARFVVDLAQQGWGVNKAGPKHEELVLEDFVGGIFEDLTSPILPDELRSRIYSFMDMPALTNFQVSSATFNNEVESRRWMLKHQAMESLTKWFDSLDYNKRIFKLEYIAGRRGVRALPKGVEDVEVQITASMSMSVMIKLDSLYERVFDNYIKGTDVTVDYVANHMKTSDASSVGARGFIRFVCNEFLRMLRSHNLTGQQTGRYDVYTQKLTLSVYPMEASDESPLYAEWMYIFLSKGVELGVTSVLHGGRNMATALKRPEPLYLPEYIEHQVEQSIQEEVKAQGREEPEDNERRVRQRLEGIFEEDEATPELADDAQRKIMSFLDMGSLTNLQATGTKLNDRINDVKHLAKAAVFPKILEWVTAHASKESPYHTVKFVCSAQTATRPGAKKLPVGVRSMTMTFPEYYTPGQNHRVRSFDVYIVGDILTLPRQRGGYTEWEARRLYETLQTGTDDTKQERAFFCATLNLCESLANRTGLNPQLRTYTGRRAVNGTTISVRTFARDSRAVYRAAAEFYYAMLTQGYEMVVSVVDYQEGLRGAEFFTSMRNYTVPNPIRGVHLPEYVDGRPEPEGVVADAQQRYRRQRVEGELDDVIGKLKNIKIVNKDHQQLVSKLARIAQRRASA